MFRPHGVFRFLWMQNRSRMILAVAAVAVAGVCHAVAFHSIVRYAVAGTAGDSTAATPAALVVGMITAGALAALAATLLVDRTAEEGCAAIAAEFEGRIARTDHRAVARLGGHRVFTGGALTGGALGGLGADLDALCAAAHRSVPVLQTAVLAAACTALMIAAAPRPATITLALAIVGAAPLRRLDRRTAAAGDRIRLAERRLQGRVDDLLTGFNALAVAADRRDGFMAGGLGPAIRLVRNLTRHRGGLQAARTLAMGIPLLGILGLAAFVLSADGWEGACTVLATLVFLAARFHTASPDLAGVERGAEALARLRALDRRLAPAATGSGVPAPPRLRRFDEIRLDSVLLRRGSGPDGGGGFVVGPVDLRLRRSEICMITGANGAGKSTLVEILSGLVPPSEGAVLFDGRRLSRRDHRDLCAAVLSDSFPFEDPGGIAADPVQVRQLLTLMGLGPTVRYEEGRFACEPLSDAQRRRLALVKVLLDPRPLVILDEWTADQDARLVETFHTRLLPQLRAQGRAVVVVTQDERYFHHADRLLRLDAGRVVDGGEPSVTTAETGADERL